MAQQPETGGTADVADRRLHVALVYPACHRRGGVERTVWEAARYLALRHRVSVVCGVADPPPGAEVVHVSGAPFGGVLAPWRFRRAAAPVVAELNADVVVSYGSDCPDADVFVVQSVHRTWLSLGTSLQLGPLQVPSWARYLLPRHQIRLVLERSAVRRAARGRIVAVSDNVASDLARWYGVPPQQMTVVPNGFDPEQCSPERSSELRDEVRGPLGLDPAQRALVFVANEYHRKGLGVLLRAMADPAMADPGLRLILAGRMDPAAYRVEMDRLGLADQVQWIGSVDDVARCYAAGDLFVLPTRYEAFGSVIVEALACGLPVVTTECAGASVVVHPDRNGLLLSDPGDVAQLATLLARALEPGTIDRWRPQCRPSVDGYEWSAVGARMEQILFDVVEDRPRSPDQKSEPGSERI